VKLFELLKSVFDDLIRYHWGDCVALFLIVFGAHLVIFGHDETTKDLGKSAFSAGLISLRMKPIGRPNGNGEAHA
jgi:Na+/phosphate symporter